MSQVRSERMVRLGFAELRDHLSQPADVGRDACCLARVHRRGPPVQVARAVHQVEEEVPDIHRLRERAQLINEGFRALRRPGSNSKCGDLVATVAQHPQHRDHVADLRSVVEPMPADDHVWKARGGESSGHRSRDRVGAAEHRDLGEGQARLGQTPGLSGDRNGLCNPVRASPHLDAPARPCRRQLLCEAHLVVADQRRRGGDDPGRAALVLAQRHRPRPREPVHEPLKTRARSAAKPVDALVVVADHEWRSPERHQLDQPLLREVEVLVLVDEHVRVPEAIRLHHARVAREHRDGSLEQVVEIQKTALAALALIGAKQAHARMHERGPLGVVRGAGPLVQPSQRDELLLQALEHLQRRRDKVVRSLITYQRRVAELPHELAREDPPFGAADDPEPCRNSHPPAVRAQPSQRDRMDGAHRRRVDTGKVLDALAHLPGGAIGEGHHQDRRGVCSRGHETPVSLGDDGRLAGAGAGDDTDRHIAQCRGFALRCVKARHVGVDRPMRTRRVRTRRPRSMPLRRAITVSASSRSWCASAGLDVVTVKTPDLSSTASHSWAGSVPITVRKATDTRMPRSRPPSGWRRITAARILPSLSTGFNSP